MKMEYLRMTILQSVFPVFDQVTVTECGGVGVLEHVHVVVDISSRSTDNVLVSGVWCLV